MKRYFLAPGLKEDAQLIAEYEQLHQKIWPEIETSIIDSCIMIMKTVDDFSFEVKSAADAESPGMGKVCVEIPTGPAVGQRRRKMADDDKNF